MFVAQVFDAVGADGQPYFSPERPRLVHPELRSRVIGYLATAPLVRSDHHTDGVWVWPDSLARHVRERGVGPQAELLEHLAARRYLLAGNLSPEQLATAAAAVPAMEVVPAVETRARAEARAVVAGPAAAAAPTTYYAGYHDRHPQPRQLVRRSRQPDGGVRESTLTASGWEPSEPATTGMAVRLEEVSRRRAADLADELCGLWNERMRKLAAETRATETGIRLARVFDDPSGSARFSPNRLRLVEPERRERLAAYLSGGRLVVRAAGRVADPLDPRSGRVVSLNYRTDGTWVWQEALSYYVRARGVAPELDLLCHVEERGFAPAPAVTDDIAARAVAVIKAPLHRLPDRQPMAYFASYDDSGPRRLVRVPGGDPLLAEELDSDLLWWPSPRLARVGTAADAGNLVEVDETEAIQVLDLWCELRFAELAGR